MKTSCTQHLNQANTIMHMPFNDGGSNNSLYLSMFNCLFRISISMKYIIYTVLCNAKVTINISCFSSFSKLSCLSQQGFSSFLWVERIITNYYSAWKGNKQPWVRGQAITFSHQECLDVCMSVRSASVEPSSIKDAMMDLQS